MRKKEQNYIFFILIISSLLPVMEGRSQKIDPQLWMNYALTVQVNKNFSYGGDVGFRG